MKDFFISYNKADKVWAEWIAYTLEEAGYSAVIQAWDFRPGGNFVLEMQKAASETEKTVVVLSDNYLKADYTQPEWAAAFVRDPKGQNRTLVPFRVEDCDPAGLLGPIIYVDLVGLTSEGAKTAVLGAFAERAKPVQAPAFPGGGIQPTPVRVVPAPVLYPGKPWNVPLSRNPFFTGRADVMQKLEAALKSSGATGVAALSGLGGIGKTQTAAEYAYRHRDDYQAVLWASAASRETMVSGFAALAALLNLPESKEKEQELAVAAVKRWLEANPGWLLILDNANDLPIAREFVPKTRKGQVLLTTQAHATGALAKRVEIENMEPKEGALFLLRRAQVIGEQAALTEASAADRQLGEAISKEVGGHPPALDQAGAYLEETGCGLEGYLELYRQSSAELLKRPSALGSDHPPVAATFTLSFARVEQANPAAAELLRLCAFLHPDAIPEEIITQGTSELGLVLQPVAADPLKFNGAVGETLKYSLLRRNPTAKTLSIHGLVQTVLQHGMDAAQRREWSERAVRGVNMAFPEVEFPNWGRCERLLVQAVAAADLIDKKGLEFPEAARLLNQTGYYLRVRARYAEAEPLCRRALEIREKALASEHPDVAQSLNNLAELYRNQGKYGEAEPLHQRALEIREKALGPEHPNVATSLSNLALLYQSQGKSAQTEPLLKRALEIWEKALGPEHPNVGASLNNLAALYDSQGKYGEAEPLLKRALEIWEKALGPEHPFVATGGKRGQEPFFFGDEGRKERLTPFLPPFPLTPFPLRRNPRGPCRSAIFQHAAEFAECSERVGGKRGQEPFFFGDGGRKERLTPFLPPFPLTPFPLRRNPRGPCRSAIFQHAAEFAECSERVGAVRAKALIDTPRRIEKK